MTEKIIPGIMTRTSSGSATCGA